MKLHIYYSMASLHSTALYIWQNNPVVTKWPSAPADVFDVVDVIKQLALKAAIKNAKIVLSENRDNKSNINSWTSFTGTGGFYITLELLHSNNDTVEIEIEFLVDTSVRFSDKGYVSEVVDILG